MDFLGFKVGKFLPSVDHDGCEDEVFLDPAPYATQFFCRDEVASTSSKSAEDNVEWSTASLERLFVERHGLLSRVAVILGVVALLDPDVDHVEYLIMHLIAGGHFLIEDLVSVVHAGVEVWLADRAIHARLVHLVEGDLRSGVLIVLEPQADALGVHFVLRIQRLHHPDV